MADAAAAPMETDASSKRKAEEMAYEFTPLAPAAWTEGGEGMPPKPFVDGAFTFVGGARTPWTGAVSEVTSPIVDAATGARAVIGSLAQMDEVSTDVLHQ